ncbi:MAG: hypothetical protein KME27_22450 [Lyngbya sp. HA4199-MV5]|nr:hypothetical protein [Lyngbya sp. HA4199-MV5]
MEVKSLDHLSFYLYGRGRRQITLGEGEDFYRVQRPYAKNGTFIKPRSLERSAQQPSRYRDRLPAFSAAGLRSGAEHET